MRINKITKIRLYNIFIFCAIMPGICDCIASEITGTMVFNSFKEREQVIKSEISKSATFKMLTRAAMFDPNQGLLQKNCDVTWGKNDVRMKIVYDYLQDPVYIPPSSTSYTYQPIDYDKNKRLIVWRFLETYIVSTPEKTEVLDKLQHFYVSSNGDIEKTAGIHKAKHVFHEKSNVNYGEFKYFLLAAGLCFSDYIDMNSLNLVKMPDKELIEITSHGNFGKDSRGTWKLTVDPNSDFFVRNATYTLEGLDHPSMEVSTSNVVKKDGLEYAREVRIVLSDLSVRDYGDIDISITDNQQLRQEVGQIMESPLPSGSEVIDFNEGEPIRRTIK